eukprot:228562_1
MQAVVATGFGPLSEVVKLKDDIPIPTIDPESDEILVKVYYASIHMGDWKLFRGDLGFLASATGANPPFVLGQDYSGQIVEIGSKIKHFQVGDLVFGEVEPGKGTIAQYIIVKPSDDEIFKKPNNISLIEAGALQCSYETAYQALVKDGKFQTGDSILILGGSTLVGMYVTQIAKNHFKSSNITVTSSRETLCKSLGADVVINYKTEKWQETLRGRKFDVIFDVLGGKQLWNDAKSNKVLAPQGKYITVCWDFGADTQITCCIMCGFVCGILNRKCWGCCCNEQKYIATMQARSKNIEEALELIVDGKVKIMIDEESPFELNHFEKCIQKSMDRKAHGKLLVKLNNEDVNIGVDKKEDAYNVVEEEADNNTTNKMQHE